ncbi:MAG: ribosomal-processing cysteine protease Prp [Clostridia bacterium]|nr:ribosomal-processing cysteine protease Prp [Clostridia bacterium]
MIYADFLKNSVGNLKGIRLADHAGFSEMGTDIVCAAVSSSFFLVANTITDVMHLEPLALRAEPGELIINMKDEDCRACEVLFKGLYIHLKDLHEQYPQNLNVNITEVQ